MSSRNNNNNNESEELDGIVICTICYERYRVSSDISACSCGHVFHHSCLTMWLNEKHNCPNCRIERPSHFKLFLDYEANNDEMQQRSAALAAAAAASVASATASAAAAAGDKSNESTSNVVENLLYENGLLTDEINYLNERFATKCSELSKKEEELTKKQLELEKLRERYIKLHSILSEIKSSISKTDTFEGLVTEIINTIVLDDDDDVLSTALAASAAGAGAADDDETDSMGSLVTDAEGAAALPLQKSIEYWLDEDDKVTARQIFRCDRCGVCHPSSQT